MCDPFVTGVASPQLQSRLSLEGDTLTFDHAIEIALLSQRAELKSEGFLIPLSASHTKTHVGMTLLNKARMVVARTRHAAVSQPPSLATRSTNKLAICRWRAHGFGAGTLADMSLMQLLLVQVPLLLVSAIHFVAAERSTQPFLSDPWSASTVSRLSSTRVHGSSSVVRGTCGPSHGGISEDQPINLGQQNSRGADQAYIGTQHDGFVGFGAAHLPTCR
ncbi:hypothetical protein HPB51_003548 [Rhipicephalus microplus]|uniref:Uncharacterized protein n=1 Tax=Rhipicephalus microplus TaxID=6941 RepID=A0A9J6EQH6_RHIMP|nr:hypothetical protein HPB51_003548 [Rhipicephalus microplus]